MRKMNLYIRSLFFDGDGSGERMESRTLGELSEGFSELTLCYADEENGIGKTELFIKKATLTGGFYHLLSFPRLIYPPERIQEYPRFYNPTQSKFLPKRLCQAS